VTINEFPIPTTHTFPLGITTGPDGNLWFTEAVGNAIGMLNPSTHTVEEFPIPTANSSPSGITTGPDGNLWFAESRSSKIGLINPTTHTIAEFSLPTANSGVQAITSGLDGTLWFTEDYVNQIGRISPSTHIITEFAIPTPLSGPSGITSGPDGNLWFTEFDGDKIGQVNPTTQNIIEFPLPSSGSGATGITAGRDGNLWFIENHRGKVGEINPTSHVSEEFSIPAGAPFPDQITAGPDGNLWFTESTEEVGKIGEINPTSHAIVDYFTPTAISTPHGITAGPDGNLWFTEAEANQIGQVVLAAPGNADLALSGTAPAVVASGQKVTYSLTVTNNGTAGATGVTLTETLPVGAAFFSATGGVTPVKGVLTFAIGDLAAGATASFSIVVVSGAAGTITGLARVSGDQADPSPADDNVALMTAVTATGPTVTSVHRFGFHAQPTLLVLTFDESLNPERAQNTDNYQIFELGGTRRNIGVKAAVYDAASRTVTLSPVHQLNLHNLFQLTIIGTGPNGVADSFGNLLDGRRSGDPGSNFVTIVSALDLIMTSKNPTILREYRKIVSRQFSRMRTAVSDRTTRGTPPFPGPIPQGPLEAFLFQKAIRGEARFSL
jgi:virginiamycin B lyase